MTLFDLLETLNRNNVPQDAKIMSDSGWECSATNVNGLYYNAKQNTVVLVQFVAENSKYLKKKGWVELTDIL